MHARLNAGSTFNIRYIDGKSPQVDSCNCALLCLQTVQCWMRHDEPNFDAQVGSSTRRARLVTALVLGAKSVHESLGHVVRAEELTEAQADIARSIRPLVFTGGIAVDDAADIHSDEDDDDTGSEDISGPLLDHDGELVLGGRPWTRTRRTAGAGPRRRRKSADKPPQAFSGSRSGTTGGESSGRKGRPAGATNQHGVGIWKWRLQRRNRRRLPNRRPTQHLDSCLPRKKPTQQQETRCQRRRPTQQQGPSAPRRCSQPRQRRRKNYAYSY